MSNCRVTRVNVGRQLVKLPYVTTNCHITVYASARHSGEVMRTKRKAEQNGILRYRPHKLSPVVTTTPRGINTTQDTHSCEITGLHEVMAALDERQRRHIKITDQAHRVLRWHLRISWCS